MCARARARVYMRACACACVCVCVRACVRACECSRTCWWGGGGGEREAEEGEEGAGGLNTTKPKQPIVSKSIFALQSFIAHQYHLPQQATCTREGRE